MTTWRMQLAIRSAPLGVVLIGAVILGGCGGQAAMPSARAAAPSASPSLTPAPTATTEPSPSQMSAPPLTQSFTSTLHGISLSHPEGWTAEAATNLWTDGPNSHSILDPHDDRLLHPTLRDHLFLSISSQPIGASTPEDWITAQMAAWADLEECTATEPIAVDGATGLIGGEGCDLAVVTTDGRGYWISLRASKDDPSAVAPYDRAWFEAVLATVDLRPEEAIDAVPLTQSFTSTLNRYSVS